MSAAEPVRLTVDAGRRYRLHVFNLGLACCAVEFLAATASAADRLLGVPVVGSPRTAQVMVVSGTVTDKMAPAVRRLYDELPEPRAVLSFGACSNSGGPYWDSYCVTKGVDQVLPVDVYVPGCPPRPRALLDGLLLLHERLSGPLPEAPDPRVGGAPVRADGPQDLRRRLP